jgi:CheY-like chemotaxis protein
MGSGLGLAISRAIVAGFGGTMTLDATTTKGATFVVRLPAASRASKLRILLLDDDAAFVKTLRMMLEADHDVRGTTDTREALAAIESGERFDAILCDMSMPTMTGAQFHARVEALGREQARRIVFVSGATGPEVTAFFARTGNPRLQKPFRADELERVLGAL